MIILVGMYEQKGGEGGTVCAFGFLKLSNKKVLKTSMITVFIKILINPQFECVMFCQKHVREV